MCFSKVEIIIAVKLLLEELKLEIRFRYLHLLLLPWDILYISVNNYF